MYICIYVYMYICIYVYMYICVYVYMYIRIHIHEHLLCFVKLLLTQKCGKFDPPVTGPASKEKRQQLAKLRMSQISVPGGNRRDNG